MALPKAEAPVPPVPVEVENRLLTERGRQLREVGLSVDAAVHASHSSSMNCAFLEIECRESLDSAKSSAA